VVSDITGLDVDYRFPAYVGMGGVKVIAPTGTLRPYGLGGFGYGRVKGTVSVEGDDVTELLDEIGALDRDDIEFNKVLSRWVAEWRFQTEVCTRTSATASVNSSTRVTLAASGRRRPRTGSGAATGPATGIAAPRHASCTVPWIVATSRSPP